MLRLEHKTEPLHWRLWYECWSIVRYISRINKCNIHVFIRIASRFTLLWCCVMLWPINQNTVHPFTWHSRWIIWIANKSRSHLSYEYHFLVRLRLASMFAIFGQSKIGSLVRLFGRSIGLLSSNVEQLRRRERDRERVANNCFPRKSCIFACSACLQWIWLYSRVRSYSQIQYFEVSLRKWWNDAETTNQMSRVCHTHTSNVTETLREYKCSCQTIRSIFVSNHIQFWFDSMRNG